MSKEIRRGTYYCDSGCDYGYCPGHKMELVFENTSDTLRLMIDGENRYVFSGDSEAQKFVELYRGNL